MVKKRKIAVITMMAAIAIVMMAKPAAAEKQLDLTKMDIIHIHTDFPDHDFRLDIDNIRLLEKDEKIQPPNQKYVKQLASIYIREIQKKTSKFELAKLKRQILNFADNDREIKMAGFDEIKKYRAALTELEKKLTHAINLNDCKKQIARLKTVKHWPSRMLAKAKFKKDFMAIDPNTNLQVAVANSMQKIMPLDMAIPVKATKKIDLTLARNESESFQIVIMPQKKLENVTVKIEKMEILTNDPLFIGEVIDKKNIEVAVVGFVKTKQRRYEVDYVGWWPDPILDFVDTVDVNEDVAQSFWITITADSFQVPGHYQAKLQVTADGEKPFEIELNVKVYDFQIPDASIMPLAISTGFHEMAEKLAGENCYEKIEALLEKHHLNIDAIYNNRTIKEIKAVLAKAKDGKVSMFCLGKFDPCGFLENTSKEGFEKEIQKILSEIQPKYQLAKEANMLHKAYIYGFDEKRMFKLLKKVTKRIKKQFPEVTILTSALDESYGVKSKIKTVDAWVPLTEKYDLKKAEKARAKGRKVWWYVCCCPFHPYANFLLEYHAIEPRLLMGTMAAKYKPDGFLYYCLTYWPKNDEVITKWPFTNWTAQTYDNYNGDGSLICVGPQKQLLATIRLANLRDGIEDYAYYKLLEYEVAKIQKKKKPTKKQKEWLKKAELLLIVPGDVVENLTNYTTDGDVLYDYRNKIGLMIEQAIVNEQAQSEEIH